MKFSIYDLDLSIVLVSLTSMARATAQVLADTALTIWPKKVNFLKKRGRISSIVEKID